ncbi:receptor-type tyrosine-protein phosphatase epsilon-like [Saccostrea echinata]|uniref:receptor-type tyrosine-protein phosphatase epsilon-like n=1 Tax=Saccostrea echinata TaxID=191078 RepID=UPI002A81FC41|nr:receptor-type tyrosine-protein phosphatase epsilon-like [Saccostrea echinata]
MQSSKWPCSPQTCSMYAANNAVDGHIETCMRSNSIGTFSPDQKVWWRVDLGNIKSIYSIRIQFKDYGQEHHNRQRGRLAGFTLYVSNTTDIQNSYLCDKDGPELPSLDLINICTIHGRYVTFYNERNKTSYPDGYETAIITELCEVNVMGCQKDGFYGQDCDLPCPVHCQEKRCHILKGTCLGCKAGWIGKFCNETCMFGYYGMECKSKCTGHCLDDSSCNHISGKCEHGCEEGWIIPTCDQPCHDGWYGPNCTYKCSSNCRNSLLCDKASGKCESCIPGYIGKLCNNSCSKGTYGQNCSGSCNTKCRGQNCFHENGFCIEGCEDGYQGNICTEKCNEGWYGENCSRHCSVNCQRELCHNVHGECSFGCKPGWTGSHCSQSCKFGLYGENCTNTCSSFCSTSLHCNKTDGNCINGCIDGYMEPKCDKSCNDGWYGKNCSQQCNENCVNQTCDHRDGMCIAGCKPGWSTANCSKACDKGFYGRNCSDTCFNCLSNECDPFNGTCIQGCNDGYMGQRCEKRCSYGKYGVNCTETCSGHCAGNTTCNRFNGTCMEGCGQPYTGEKCDHKAITLKKTELETSGADNGVLGGSLATCFIFIGAVVITTIFIIRRRRNIRGKNTANRQQSSVTLTSNSHEEIEINGIDNVGFKKQSVQEKVCPKHKTVTILELEERIRSMSDKENGSFKEEYEKIPKGELYPCTEGKKPENVSKNRYTTTFPYDHSRVILKKSNPKESDYINANYIENAQDRRAYIATQGPKPKTITDFWRMVWQENISIIVCLTNLKEGMKTKCALYWPNANDKIQNGQLYVRHQDEKVYANHTVRKLRIQNIFENTERDVIMFHYTQWPDHGVPDPLSLVIFHRHVMRMSATYYAEYTLVHCSAGIGRTGTYIALDALYRQAEETGEINVPKYLKTMRKDRMNMIQGEDQYKTVYLALFESFRGKVRSISTDRFLEEFQEQSCYINLGHVANKSPLSAEFEELLSLRKEYSDKDYEFAIKNKEANLTPNVLPVDEYMCQAFDSKGARRYYNAVLLQSFTRSDCLISAQFPLPDYIEDFLSLVRAFYTPIIVSLFPLREFPSSSFWIPRKNENKTVGEFTTKFSDCTKMPNIVKTNIALQSKSSSDVRVTILESITWRGENDTAGRRILIDLIKEAKMEENTHPGGRILLLSSDGAKRCGQFCVVYNALEQMTMDREVDIFTITRLLQIRRPEFINNLEDYQFCYDAVADYLQNDTIYANC